MPAIKGLVVGHELVTDIHARDEHSPAAIPFHPQSIQDFFRVLTAFDTLQEICVLIGNKITASETSNWNNQFCLSLLPIGFLLATSRSRSSELFRFRFTWIP